MYDPSILCSEVFILHMFSWITAAMLCVMFLCFKLRLLSILFACLISSSSVGNDRDVPSNIYCIVIFCFYITVQAIASINAFAVSMNGTVCVGLS